MNEIGISGVWKASNGEITHYAVHVKMTDGFSTAKKTTKADAIRMVKSPQNKVKTWVWNYQTASFKIGEEVTVVNGKNGEYLRTHPDNTLKDNLSHLIDCGWFF